MVEALERELHAFMGATSADPKPFRRVISAVAILANGKGFCSRTPARALMNNLGQPHPNQYSRRGRCRGVPWGAP